MPALPVHVHPPVFAAAQDVLLGMAVPSSCGRVTAQQVLHPLGWEPGRRLDIQPYEGMLVVCSAHGGRHQIGSRGELPLPAPARRMCGIKPGQPVLLAALVTHDLLVVHPAGTVVRLLADLHTRLAGAGHVR